MQQSKLKKMNLTYEDNLDIVRDSGIPDYVLKADQSEIKSIDDILKRSHDIKEFAKDCKDDLIDAFFALNYRISLITNIRGGLVSGGGFTASSLDVHKKVKTK